MDCTAPEHEDWQLFREQFLNTAVLDPDTGDAFPSEDDLLSVEGVRLFKKWLHKLPVQNEDYPKGSADFYHGCHFGESSDYCLYGHVAVIVYLAKYNAGHRSYELARVAMRMLHWNHCLDYLESSNWGFSVLTIWDLVDGFAYPQVTSLHQYMLFGPGIGSNVPVRQSTEAISEEPQGRPSFWIFEFGTHRALSNEPLSILREAFADYEVVHQNFVKTYEGKAEAFIHPFPRHCSPDCPYQQDSVPYSFPVVEDAEESRAGFHNFLHGSYLTKPQVRKNCAFLCTNPIFYCYYFLGLNRTVFGYFGLPLLYMAPTAGWAKWLTDFAVMAKSPQSFFVANNPMLAAQVDWQSAIKLRVVRPVASFLTFHYSNSRPDDVLVPEPREACVLHCLLRSFTPANYPLRFFGKADTDRRLETFASFRAIVLYPHDFALMSFYEFYAMGVPLFMPSHLSKYLFPYSASVPLLDWVPENIRHCRDCGPRAPFSPMSLKSSAALKYWSRAIDFFLLPAVQLFPSIAALLEMLPDADLYAISSAMRQNRDQRHKESLSYWQGAAAAAIQEGLKL